MSKQSMPAHGNRRYPWKKWESGKVVRARQGTHFQITPENFRRSLVVRAIRRGLKVATHVVGSVVTFQFSAKE